MKETLRHQIAAYCYAEAVLNTEEGVYTIDIEDILDRFDIEKISFEDYEEIVDTIYEDYSLQILDVNEGTENEYYFDNDEISLNIGTNCYLNNEGEE